ncbi:MAG TPA: hypothetical protein VKA44_02310, partial [Gemmatimonadota bacterium]|nr:hypothetical protein [Gemmatimonadota bacterium]
PLRQASAEASAADAWLFRPDTATLVRSRSFDVPESAEPYVDPVERAAGENPPSGAILDYRLARDANSVALEVVDGGGEVVRRYTSTEEPRAPDPKSMDIPAGWISAPEVLSAKAGPHRWTWDLRWASAGGNGGGFFGGGGPWALPGAYTVRLVVGGAGGRADTLSRPLVVRQDPRQVAPEADLAAQLALARGVEDASGKAATALREIRAVRARIDSLEAKAEGNAALAGALRAAGRKAEAIEGTVPPADPDAAGVGSGGPDVGTLLYLRSVLGALRRAVESGAAAPTAGEKEGFAKASRSLDAALDAWESLKHGELERLDARLREAGLEGLPDLGEPGTRGPEGP